MPFDVRDRAPEGMIELSRALRAAAPDATSLEDVASSMVMHLRDEFIDKDTGRRTLELVRFYKVVRFDDLPDDLEDFARAATPETRTLHGVPCLTLLASAGTQPEWNDRRASVRHKAIPLVSVEAVAKMPMVAQLIRQLGADLRLVVEDQIDPDSPFSSERNVFYVEDALDSPYVPAQREFVVPHGIRSVIGFGGVLPDRSIFALVGFFSAHIPSYAVPAVPILAESAKLAVLPFTNGPIFRDDRARRAVDPVPPATLDEARFAALDRLVEHTERLLLDQSALLAWQSELAGQESTTSARDDFHAELRHSRHAAIVDGALDCIVAMDAAGHIIDFNPAAEATFGYRREDVIGELMYEKLVPPEQHQRHLAGVARVLDTGEKRLIGRRAEVRAMRADGTEFDAELSIGLIESDDGPVFIGYIRDISERLASEQALLSSRERLAHVARTLQASLLPARLPTIPGLELAAVYRAAGEGNDVGGDFYDAFPIDHRRWAVVLGDVCGKGPAAASLTALARYTLRAAIISGADPEQAMTIVNEAIRRERPEDFCTLVCVIVDPVDRSVQLTSAGHPPAMRLRPDGTLGTSEASGYMLGPFPAWKGDVESFDLESGEALVLYSDGLTEARNEDELFGDDELDRVLRGMVGATADAIVDGLEDAAMTFSGGLRDDLAVVAIRVA